MYHTREKAFLDLIAEHKGILFKVANIYGKSPEDRKDLFQEMTINLWRAFDSFNGDSKVSTWIYQICLNTAVTNYRKEKKQVGRVEAQKLLIHELWLYADDWKSEQLTFLYKAIEGLDKPDKAIVLLYLEEKSHKEISDIIGITVSNVAMRISRIKAKLADIYRLEK
jgi:RNA polymerase sigma-70 factor (ECF subfamily)